LSDFSRFARRVAFFGALNSLAQTLLKIASPGVPDFYQGTELWQLSFVDPDNRRAVDFTKRRQFLHEIGTDGFNGNRTKKLLENWHTGEIKLFLTYKALQFRRSHPALFESGSYLPLRTAGARTDHLCSFARRSDGHWMIAVAPRFISSMVEGESFPLGDCWNETSVALPDGAPRRWLNVFTAKEIAAGEDGDLPVSAVFEHFAVALLAAED
jgi:(1->4)-alpha-D-glucan 1-alpha-D-glucosylmutase